MAGRGGSDRGTSARGGAGQGSRAAASRRGLRGRGRSEEADTVIEEYREQTRDAAERAETGFRGHFASWAGVTGLLAFIWAMTSGFSAPMWFLAPMFGWGIGIANHFTQMRASKRESRELDSMQRPTREQVRLHRKLAKARAGWWGHLTSVLSVSALLAVINLAFSPGFLWFTIPTGVLSISAFAHWPAFRSRQRSLLKKLQAAGASIATFMGRSGGQVADASAHQVASDPVVQESERLRGAILENLKRYKGTSPLGRDAEQVLDTYVKQIKLLSEKDHEIEDLISGIPTMELEEDLAELRSKQNQASTERMQKEYQHSIDQIEKQQQSFTELQNEKEMLSLRLQSSLNALKQMQIDLARMRSISPKEESHSLEHIKEKSNEISQYLEDLRAGYAELDK